MVTPAQHARGTTLRFESLEPRLLHVVATVSPSDLIVPISSFTGVAEIKTVAVGEGHLCTGTLLPTGRHVLTAAHCWDFIQPDQTLYVRFQISQSELTVPFNRTTDVTTHDGYERFKSPDGNDISIITLNCAGACAENISSATRYDVFRPSYGSDLLETEIVGYGAAGTGAAGLLSLTDPAVKRAGKNRFEIYGHQLNERSAETGGFTVPAGRSETLHFGSLAYDFDNNSPGGVCDIPQHPQHLDNRCDALAEYLDESQYNDPSGFGNLEAAATLGDSGGPNFVTVGGSRKIAGVTSHIMWHGFKTDIHPGQLVLSEITNFGEVNIATRVGFYETGDTNSDGIPDGNLNWIDGLLDIKAPKVTKVKVGASAIHSHNGNSAAAPDVLPVTVETGVVDGVAVQYKSVPFNKANKITIEFSEPVKFCAPSSPSGQSKLQISGNAGISHVVRQPPICSSNPDATSPSPYWTIDGIASPTTYDRGLGWTQSGGFKGVRSR